MSILNRPSDGLFNVLLVVFKALSYWGPQTRERIESLCAPGSISKEKIGQTLIRWTQLGLIEFDGEKYSINPKLRPKKKDIDTFVQIELAKKILKIVLHESNNKNLWDSEGARSADFTRGIAWLLTQNIYAFPTSSHPKVAEVEKIQILDESKRMLQNNTRWNGLKEWAKFLGFGWDGKDFVIDPTQAVNWFLPEVFESKRTLTTGEFIAVLSRVVPVLDQGIYRLEVESALNTKYWEKPNSKHLSKSISRAMKRLEVEGVLRLESRADSGEVYQLLGQGDTEWGAVSHVTWNKKEAR